MTNGQSFTSNRENYNDMYLQRQEIGEYITGWIMLSEPGKLLGEVRPPVSTG